MSSSQEVVKAESSQDGKYRFLPWYLPGIGNTLPTLAYSKKNIDQK